eukprot:635047-Prymnesium_polylepis.1
MSDRAKSGEQCRIRNRAKSGVRLQRAAAQSEARKGHRPCAVFESIPNMASASVLLTRGADAPPV